MKRLTSLSGALCAWLVLATAWAQSPDPRGSRGGDRFDVTTAPQRDSQVDCFDRALRGARAAQHAYQVVRHPEWNRQQQCAGGRSEAAPTVDIGPCWDSLIEARSLLEQSAPLFEQGRRTPGPRQTDVIAQANALVKQAARLLDSADRCFRPLAAQAQRDSRRSSSPPAPAGTLPWELPAAASNLDEQQRPPSRSSASSPEEAAAKLKSGWHEVTKGKRSVLYASTRLGGAQGQTLHAVQVTGPIFIGYAEDSCWLQDFIDHKAFELDDRKTLAVGVVTGTFSDWQAPVRGKPPPPPPKLGGPVVQNGALIAPVPPAVGISSPALPRSFLGHNSGGYFATPVGRYADAYKREEDILARFRGNERERKLQGIGGLAQLMQNGRTVVSSFAVAEQRFRDPDQVSEEQKNANAVAGVTADRRTLYLLVVEGDGNVRPRTGASGGELARILRELGVSDAVLMDGGGSAQIYIPGFANSRPRGSGRKLPSGILF